MIGIVLCAKESYYLKGTSRYHHLPMVKYLNNALTQPQSERVLLGGSGQHTSKLTTPLKSSTSPTMSADLLAEFDTYYRASQQKATNTAVDQVPAPKPKPISESIDFCFFDSDATQPTASTTQCAPQLSHLTSSNSTRVSDKLGFRDTHQQESQDGFDAWGDFESPTLDTATSKPNNAQKSYGLLNSEQSSNAFNNGHTAESRPGPMRVRAATSDFFSANISNLVQSSVAQSQGRGSSERSANSKGTLARPSNNRSNILFDADELSEDDEDEFGDFETVSQVPQTQQQQQLDSFSVASRMPDSRTPKNPYPLSFSSTTLNPTLYPYPQAPKSPSFQERNPFAELELRTDGRGVNNADEPTSPVTPWPNYAQSHPQPQLNQDSPTKEKPQRGNWGQLIAETSPVRAGKKVVTPIRNDSWDWDAIDVIPGSVSRQPEKEDSWTWDVVDAVPKEEKPVLTDSSPPTNIPPPSVLLTIFPQLFNLLQTTLFQAVSNQPFSLKNRIISDPSTIDFLRAYILIAVVAAQIVAGRKSRWKRDTHLSQAMKIGPAVAGGKSGMKLMGVDKAEISREDREAAELVRSWKEQIGRLRSAVAVANSSLHDQSTHLMVPEINETMTVRTATVLEGALTAPKCCFLCGLKRNERIFKIDVQVEDSFGEWWVEHWGHRTCKNFWIEHESKLKQR